MFDVVVVGGGPAGALAAYELSKKSLKVALLEKEKLPRYKACGGVVAPHVEKLIDFSIEPTVERCITKMRVTTNLDARFVTGAPRPFARMVMRDTFDDYLLKAAEKAGTTVYQESPLTSLEEAGSGYIARAPKVEIRARYVVGADGANSRTRKLVGAPRHKRASVALSWEIKSSPERLEKWRDTIAIDLGHFASGYAWVFPKADNFSIGAVGPKSTAKHLVAYCAAIAGYYADEIGSTRPYITMGHHLPIRAPDEAVVFGGTLLVGDAAGLIEPLVGEGIYYAMQSAKLAAETIVEATRVGDDHLREYQRKVDRQIQPEIQVSKSLLYLLDLAPRFWVPRLLAQTNPFWNHFYRIFTGERNYQDLPRKLGPFGILFHSLLARDNLK